MGMTMRMMMAGRDNKETMGKREQGPRRCQCLLGHNPMPDDDTHSTRPLHYEQLLIGRKAGAYEPAPAGRGNNAKGQERGKVETTQCLPPHLRAIAHRMVRDELASQRQWRGWVIPGSKGGEGVEMTLTKLQQF
ncbi:hypothetical protein L208DRAFT_429947 [Tricholoma matsutake]|nr:hypothetical protein L208DRAFT_429947 [Tricholoma matsutake 945]